MVSYLLEKMVEKKSSYKKPVETDRIVRQEAGPAGGNGDDQPEMNLAMDELKAQNMALKAFTESAPVGIFSTDPDGKTHYVNPHWCRLSGLSFNEAMGDGWMKAVHPDDLPALKAGWEEAVAVRQASGTEYRFMRPDGSVTWVLGNSTPQFNASGDLTGYIGTITDITEKKKILKDLIAAKEKAEESDRLKTSFLNNISHEIRTPLNAITGFCAFLSDPGLSHEKRESFTKIIIESSDQLLFIITDIINIAAIESGLEKVQEKTFNLNTMIKMVTGRFMLRAGEQYNLLRYQTFFPDDEAEIVTDRTKLIQILSNLLNNAVKFTKKGKITIGYSLKDGNLEFYVRDTGIGIPGKMHNEIFQRFRQVESSDNRNYGGSGLGLSISKSYIEMLDGKIWVDSEPGRGSTFCFAIPYKKPGP